MNILKVYHFRFYIKLYLTGFNIKKNSGTVLKVTYFYIFRNPQRSVAICDKIFIVSVRFEYNYNGFRIHRHAIAPWIPTKKKSSKKTVYHCWILENNDFVFMSYV